MKNFGTWLVAAIIGASPLSMAQEKSSMQQLLDELRQKGVLDDADYKKISGAASKEGAADGSLSAGYDKGFFLKSKDEVFSLKMTGYGQVRYTYFDKDQDVSSANEDKSSFRIRRARVKFEGTTFRPWVRYVLQWENAGSSLTLRDYYVDLYDKKSLPEIGIKFGQFKTPFSRQFITSSQLIDFTERSIASEAFFFDRDQGAAIHGKPFGSDPNVEYTTGLFNGNGQNQSDNVDVGLLWVSRLDWNILGEVGYSEGDVDDSQDAKWAIGSSFGYNVVTPTTGPLASIDRNVSRWEADTSFKYMGCSLQAEYYVNNESLDNYLPADPNGGINAKGMYLQGGFFVLPKELELAARYAYVRPDIAGTPNQQEMALGCHYYFSGHPWKLQADIRRLTTAHDPGIDNRELQFIVQMQVSF